MSDGDREAPALFTPFTGFAGIARRSYASMLQLQGDLPREPSFQEDDGTAHAAWLYSNSDALDAIGDHAAITVIMSAAAIELYINDCAVRLLGEKCAEKIDRLTTEGKCLIVPRLHRGYQVAAACENQIHALYKARNHLMHPKTKEVDPTASEKFTKQKRDVPGTREYLPNAATNAIAALDALYSEAENWDPDRRHHLQA